MALDAQQRLMVFLGLVLVVVLAVQFVVPNLVAATDDTGSPALVADPLPMDDTSSLVASPGPALTRFPQRPPRVDPFAPGAP